jgi:hypothetical protein
MTIKLKEGGATLTWVPRPSSDPGSEITTLVAAVAAAGAPGGDQPQMVAVAAGPMVVVVAVGPMVVVAARPED